jgi:hypothetical protein
MVWSDVSGTTGGRDAVRRPTLLEMAGQRLSHEERRVYEDAG